MCGLQVAIHSLALIVAIGFLALSVTLHRQERIVGAFYDAPPIIGTAPGQLLRTQRFGRAIPDGSRAWLILYTTRSSLGDPALGSAVVLAPTNLPLGPRPVVVWTHGTVGVARTCAPSLHPQPFADLPSIPQLLHNGWVMVAPDYVGMGTDGVAPYLIGTGQAYSALDAARAAHQLRDLALSNHTVVWGHSQGGHAALWTATLAHGYAPELRLDGVAALAPATDLVSLGKAVQGHGAGTVVSAYLIYAYSRTYNDVRFDEYVRPGARAQVTAAAGRCTSSPGVAASLIAAGAKPGTIFRADLGSGSLGNRLRENTPAAAVGAPLLVAQGTNDEVIPIAITERWVQKECAAGHKLDFRRYPKLTHMSLLAAPSLNNELAAWTADRFAARPAPTTC